MASPACYNIPITKSVTVTAVAVSRGARLTLASTGTAAASAATVRGDYVALQDIPASGIGLVAPIESGGSVPLIPDGAIAIGDAVYSAASGKVSTTSTNAVLIGKAVQASSGDGVLFAAELKSAL